MLSPRRSAWPVAAAVGVLADGVIGEPPGPLHPVRAFGSVMQRVEHIAYADARANGVVHAAVGAALGLAAGAGMALGRKQGLATAIAIATATYLAVAGRELGAVARRVGDALTASDLTRARELLPALVGRDVTSLDAEGVARAVVESVAENTVDGVVAPAWWAAIAGAPGALGYRAVNTLDSMVGYRNDRYSRYGWASARLDDAVAFVPARLTAVLVAVVRPGTAPRVWRAVRLQAPAHPSPNAGVAEAAFAAALGVRLGGEIRYEGRVERRPELGTGRPPEAGDIDRAVRLLRDVRVALAVVLLAAGAVTARRRPRVAAP